MTYIVEDSADHNDNYHHNNNWDEDGIPRNGLYLVFSLLSDGH